MGAVRYATAPFPLTPVWPLQYPLHSTDSLLCLTLPPVSDSKPAVHLVLVPLLHRRSLSSYPPSSFSSIRTLLKKCVSCLRPRNHAPVSLFLGGVRSCCTLFPPSLPPFSPRAERPKLLHPFSLLPFLLLLLFLLVLGVRSCHTHHLSAARHTSCVGASDGHRAQSGKRCQSPQGALPAP